MAFSRGASALGVALALGELSPEQLSETDICSSYELYSQVASTSAGVELQNCEILVLGNAANSHSNYVVAHSVMAHALDQAAVQRAIDQAGGGTVVNVFAKADRANAYSLIFSIRAIKIGLVEKNSSTF